MSQKVTKIRQNDFTFIVNETQGWVKGILASNRGKDTAITHCSPDDIFDAEKGMEIVKTKLLKTAFKRRARRAGNLWRIFSGIAEQDAALVEKLQGIIIRYDMELDALIQHGILPANDYKDWSGVMMAANLEHVDVILAESSRAVNYVFNLKDKWVKCIIRDEDYGKSVGIARLHPNDGFDPSVGANIARLRALLKLYKIRLTKAQEMQGFTKEQCASVQKQYAHFTKQLDIYTRHLDTFKK